MRPFLFSLGLFALALGTGWAQSSSGTGGFQIAFGQTYKDFRFPMYQNGQLSYTVDAVSAKGVTLNRAQTIDLKIQLYTNGKMTTTITSPNADIYLADRVMRTKNTVKIERTDLEATSQSCDFDLINKKYLLRQNVRVVLKNFDIGGTVKPGAAGKPTAPASAAQSSAAPREDVLTPIHPRAAQDSGNPLDMPGAYSSTNAAPAPKPTLITP